MVHLFIWGKHIKYKLKHKNTSLTGFYRASNTHVVKDNILCAWAEQP